MAINYSDPVQKFKQQARQAKQRGIDWLLTFEEWMHIWQASGKWELRGKKAGQYVMARKGDVGPYSPANVDIKLFTDNIKESFDLRKAAGRFKTPVQRQGRPVRGWTLTKKGRPYQVMYGNKYIGCFATQAEAEAAYAAAREQGLARHAPIVFRSPV